MPAAFDKLRPRQLLSLLAAMPAFLTVMLKWTSIPLQRLVDGLKSDRLRAAFSVLYGDSMRDFPAGGLFMMLGFMAKKSAGYPFGGSAAPSPAPSRPNTSRSAARSITAPRSTG